MSHLHFNIKPCLGIPICWFWIAYPKTKDYLTGIWSELNCTVLLPLPKDGQALAWQIEAEW